MAGSLRVVLAGAVGLEVDGMPVPMTGIGRSARSTFAYLVCHRHRPVSRDEVAELLWGDELPQSWDQMLRGVTQKLRRLLALAGADATAVLATESGTFRLQLPPGAVVDVEEAAQLIERAETAVDAGCTEAAEQQARAAVQVAERQFMVDGAGVWIEHRQADLRELHLRALDVLARAALHDGRWTAAVDAAERALAVEPFRESAYVRLMEAHEQGGSRGEALGSYERCRRMLTDELGVRPSASTEAVYLRLLGSDDGPDDDAPQTTPLPLPAALATARDHVFVAREAEIERLSAAVSRAALEGRQAVLIAGEPGAGKTTLVGHAARKAHAAGARVLYGRCDEELGVAYQPFAEAVSQYVSSCPLAELQAHCATWDDELARLAPALTRRVSVASRTSRNQGDEDRWRLFEAVADMLKGAAMTAPTILILDDLHWAPGSTLLLLRHLLAVPSEAPLLIVGTYRHTDMDLRHPLRLTLADLRRAPALEWLDLRGLDEEGVRDFVEATGAFPGEDARTVARSLHARTAGNPFFVTEILRHCRDAGTLDVSVPASVVEVVLRRLQRLSPAVTRVLLLASVVGAEFDLDVLERASGRAAGDVVEAVEEAVAAHLVDELSQPGRYRFAHAVVRHAVYGTLGQARRARTHRDVGEALASLADCDPTQLPALAHHFAEAASAGCAAKAADYAIAAARMAIADRASEQAVSLVERGMAAFTCARSQDSDRRLDLLLTLGEAQRRAGRPEHRTTLIDAARLARELDDAERTAQAALANSRGYCSVSWAVDTQRVEMLQAALAAVEPGDGPSRARLLANVAAETLYVGTPARSRLLSDEALAMARRLGDPETIAAVLNPRFNTIRGDPTSLPERVANADDFLVAAESTGDLAMSSLAWGWRALTAMETGDLVEVERSFARCQELDAEVRQPTIRWNVMWTRSAILLFSGQIAEAVRLSREAYAIGRAAGHADAQLIFESQMFQVSFEQGRLDRFDRSSTAPGNTQPSLPSQEQAVPREQALHVKRSCVALAYSTLDRREEARKVFEKLAENGFQDFARLPSWLYTITNCADVCAYLSDTERAAILFDLIRPFEGHIVTLASVAYTGSACHHLGLLSTTLGRFDEADELYARAARTHEQMGAAPWLARTRVEWARLLRARCRPGDTARAGRLLEEAAVTASSLGLAMIQRDAQALLGSGGSAKRVPTA